MEAALTDLVAATDRAGPVRVSLAQADLPAEPTAMDARLQEHVAAAAESEGTRTMDPHASGAGHDAQIIADRMPCAMLFVPSIGGVSHDFTEDTSAEDIVRLPRCCRRCRPHLEIPREGLAPRLKHNPAWAPVCLLRCAHLWTRGLRLGAGQELAAAGLPCGLPLRQTASPRDSVISG